jgi:hypothetical protein
MNDTTLVIEDKRNLRVTAFVKPEALSFLHAHGCCVEHYQGCDVVIFPFGSHKEPLSPTSYICSTITLPDGTILTVMDCFTRSLLLIIDLVHGHCRHLSQ